MPELVRRPRGYIGRNHETVGSDLLALIETVSMPEHIFGPELTERMRAARKLEWYPIQVLMDPLQILVEKLGKTALRRLGRQVFARNHAQIAKEKLKSGGDFLFSLDMFYHLANRGDGIGGWKVLTFGPGEATLEKTTPHPCIMEEGIVDEGLRTMNCPANVTQTECILTGARTCIFQAQSVVKGEKWMGSHPVLAR